MIGKAKGLWLALGVAALLVAALQDAKEDTGPEIPDVVKPFWTDYWKAKQADDEDEEDHAVRNHRAMAERTLGILLDDYCQHATPEMPDELRTLAMSMDRVDRHERFMGRVRFVLDLDPPGRKARYDLFQREYAAERALDAALTAPTEDSYARISVEFVRVGDGFEKLGDPEAAILALRNAASIELRRNRLWERAGLLERIGNLAAKLSWQDIELQEMAEELTRLKQQGYDPDKPKGADAPGGSAVTSGAGGAPAAAAPETKKDALESFAPGSQPLTFKLQTEANKKGLGSIVLPTFGPLDNYFLWTFTSLTGNAAQPFDTQRSIHLQIAGQRWNIVREATKYGFDTNGDSKPEIMFTPTNVPDLVDVPLPDGSTYPMMVCIGSDREQQFGMEVNFEPQADRSELFFAPGGGRRGDVQGESWLAIDNNLSGVFGDTVDEWGDGTTPTEPGEEPFWRDDDAIVIGKSRTAVPWSSVLPLADGFWRATLKPDGSELTLHKLQLDSGFVKLDCATKVQPTHVLIEEVSGTLPGAILNVVPAKRGGTVAVPAGSWRFVMGRIESGVKTTMQQVRIYRGHAAPFEVKAGQTATLQLGAPYALRFKPSADDVKVNEDGDTEVAFWSMRIYGRGGEEYARIFDEPLQPDVEVFAADGKKVGKPHKTAVADTSLFQKYSEKALYFPAPMSLTLPKGSKPTFQLSQQKSHGLLGGPFLPEETKKPAAGKP